MLTDILVGVEVVASLALVLLILLHSGRGSGLSDMFGSSIGSAAAVANPDTNPVANITKGSEE